MPEKKINEEKKVEAKVLGATVVKPVVTKPVVAKQFSVNDFSEGKRVVAKPKEVKEIKKEVVPTVKKSGKDKSKNPMKDLVLEKIIVHICSGETGPKLEKAKSVLTMLTGKKPVETKAKVKLPKWGLRPGLPIGAKLTLRGKEALAFLKKCLEAKSNTIKKNSLDATGNFAFGIPEYIDIKGMKYDPKTGIFGFDVIASIKRKGFRIKYRHIKRKSLNNKLRIKPQETEKFLTEKLGVKLI